MIDVHTHVFPRGLPVVAPAHGGEAWPSLEVDGPRGQIVVNGRVVREVDDQYWSADRRISLMDDLDIDVQVISPLPLMLPWWASGSRVGDWCRTVNESVAAMVAEHPCRLVGLGMLPMADVDEAFAELDHIRRLGLAGVEVGTALDGERTCADPSLATLYAKLVADDTPVLIHPVRRGVLAVDPPSLEAAVVAPIDTMQALLPMVWPTAVDGPRACIAHGGGTLPWTWPRLCSLAGRSGDVLPEWLHVDTAAVSLLQVRYLAEMIGSSRVMFGTDCPAVTPAAIRPLLDSLRGLGRLGAEVLFDNPSRFLGEACPDGRAA